MPGPRAPNSGRARRWGRYEQGEETPTRPVRAQQVRTHGPGRRRGLDPAPPPHSLCSWSRGPPSPTTPVPQRPSPWPGPGPGPSARQPRCLPGPAPCPLLASPRRPRRRPRLCPPHPPLEPRRPRQASSARAGPPRLFPWRRGAGPPRGAEAAQGAALAPATPPRPPGKPGPALSRCRDHRSQRTVSTKDFTLPPPPALLNLPARPQLPHPHSPLQLTPQFPFEGSQCPKNSFGR